LLTDGTNLASSGAGGDVQKVLTAKLPLINKSIADLFDVTGPYANFLAVLADNPATTLQALETLLENALGLPTGSNVLAYDTSNAGNPALKVNLHLADEFNKSLPFNYDLTAALKAYAQSHPGSPDDSFWTPGRDHRRGQSRRQSECGL
jgi:hypothetical protein